MAFPIAVRAATALANASPAVAARVLAYVNRSGNLALASTKALTTALTSRPAVAALVVAGLVDAGLSVSSIFEAGDESDPTIASLLERLSKTTQKVVSSDSELSIGDDETAEKYEDLKRIMNWAKQQFGSVSSIRNQHVMSRAFHELDDDSLDRGIRLFLQ